MTDPLRTEQRGFTAIEIVIILAIIAILGAIAWQAAVDRPRKRDEWLAFAEAHKCKVTAKMEGTTETGVAPIIGGKGGVAITSSSTPAKTGWLCDDGITYWRND